MELSARRAVRVRSRWKRKRHAKRENPVGRFAAKLPTTSSSHRGLASFIFDVAKVKRQPNWLPF
jgi:hypothetical protein